MIAVFAVAVAVAVVPGSDPDPYMETSYSPWRVASQQTMRTCIFVDHL